VGPKVDGVTKKQIRASKYGGGGGLGARGASWGEPLRVGSRTGDRVTFAGAKLGHVCVFSSRKLRLYLSVSIYPQVVRGAPQEGGFYTKQNNVHYTSRWVLTCTPDNYVITRTSGRHPRSRPAPPAQAQHRPVCAPLAATRPSSTPLSWRVTAAAVASAAAAAAAFSSCAFARWQRRRRRGRRLLPWHRGAARSART
jgi:hypothetical protein